MFPILYEDMKDLMPEVFFGGVEVPPYLNIELESNYSLEEIVSSIRSIGYGAESCGYIDEDGIHFHIPDDEMIQVDLSKRFVFVSRPYVNGGENPSALQIFSFLKDPVSKALFIGSDRATLVEKTEQTLILCKALDQLWAQPEIFLSTMKEMVESEEAREKGLACLLKTYEEETIGFSSEMWMFWDTFGDFLMRHKLGLQMQTILW